MLVVRVVLAIALAVACVTIVSAHLAGSPPGHTGAPGEGTCADAGCHDSFGVNSGPGAVWIRPTPDCSDTVFMAAGASSGSTRRQFGFQVTVFRFNTADPIGQFVITDTVRTQLLLDTTGRTYVGHTLAAAGDTGDTSTEWLFRWVGDQQQPDWVNFYITGVVSNEDGTPSGDYVYSYLQTQYLPVRIELPGDVNVDGVITSGDLIYLVNFAFKSGSIPQPCEANGDVNCSGAVTSADIIYLVGHLFKSLPGPCDICGTPGAMMCW